MNRKITKLAIFVVALGAFCAGKPVETPVAAQTTQPVKVVEYMDVIPKRVRRVAPSITKSVKYRINWEAEDAELLARLIYSEARGEGRQGMLMVAQCVIDRYNAGRWGNSLRQVILSKQFAAQGKLTDECLEVAIAALNGERVFNDHNIFYFKVTNSTKDWYADYISHVGAHAVYGEQEVSEILDAVSIDWG